MARLEERMIQTNYDNIVGSNLKRIRLSKGLKAADIVRKLQLNGYDINNGTFWKIESGRNNPSAHLLILVAEILDCDFNALFLH